MKLRERFVLTLILITMVLVAPAVYGLFALRNLQDVAENLRARDALGALALGRLQTAFQELESDEKLYVALGSGPERTAFRQRVQSEIARVQTEMARLRERGYEAGVTQAETPWRHLLAAIEVEQRLVEAGRVDEALEHREQVVNPAFAAVDRSLDPIGEMINRQGADEVDRARTIAASAATTTLLALGVAFAIALMVGAWLARGVLRPIQQLRHGMAVVAEGDFEPEVGIAPDRQDELGDLARSFHWMAGKLADLERLRAQFVAVASHELKTPLSVIKGYVSLIEEGIYGEVTPEQEKALNSVSDQSDRLARLIQQLLDISRFEAGGGHIHLQPMDLRAFLDDLKLSFDALAMQNQIDFTVTVDPSLPATIQGDPDRLNEVVGNLLSNAFKFTRRQGRISVRARALPDDAERVEIEVTDTGVGIPGDKLPRIFEKFYQVENEAQPLSVGSGLGLAISKEIVEAHEGTITADSRVGEGTTFRVVLPVSPHPQGGVSVSHSG